MIAQHHMQCLSDVFHQPLRIHSPLTLWKLTFMTTSKVSLPRWVQPMGVLVGYGRAGGEWDQGSCSLAFFLGSHLGLAAALSWRSQFPSDTPLWVIITTSFSVSLGPRTSNRHIIGALPCVVPLYPLHTFINSSFFKPSYNYPNLSAPSASCWVPDRYTWLLSNGSGLEIQTQSGSEVMFLPLVYSYTLVS